MNIVKLTKDLSNNYTCDIIRSKLFLLILYYLCLYYNINKSKEESSKILLTMRGPGEKNILNNNFYCIPDNIIVNDNPSSNIDKVVYLPNPINNITLIWNSQIDSCINMFKDLEDLLYVDLSSFDASSVTSMQNMFYGCNSLTSINFNKIKTPKLMVMPNMFNVCSSLISLNLNDFDTSSVINMGHLFNGCSSLKSLNIDKIDTSKVYYMDNMFKGCSSLTSLNLRNFNTSSVIKIDDMFIGCSSLISLNLKNFDTSLITSPNNIFNGCNSNLTICINKEQSENLFLHSSNIQIDCNEICDPIDLFNDECKMDDIQNNIRKEIQNKNLDDLIYKLINNEKEDLIIEDKNIKYEVTTTKNMKLILMKIRTYQLLN